MALPQSLLIEVSKLSGEENQTLRKFSQLHSQLVTTGVLDAAIDHVVTDRMAFAHDFLAHATADLAIGGEMSSRNALSRGYYAVHHAVRAVLLYDLKQDFFGHFEAIDSFNARLQAKPPLKAKLTSIPNIDQKLVEMIHSRHLADYYVYGTKGPKEPALDFNAAASTALAWISVFLAKLEEYLSDRRANLY